MVVPYPEREAAKAELDEEKQVGAAQENGEHVVLVPLWEQSQALVPVSELHNIDGVVGPGD